jgi:hypothetical protein
MSTGIDRKFPGNVLNIKSDGRFDNIASAANVDLFATEAGARYIVLVASSNSAFHATATVINSAGTVYTSVIAQLNCTLTSSATNVRPTNTAATTQGFHSSSNKIT